MKIISFDALDKSGKHTQTTMLWSRLVKEGYTVVKSEFPRYDTETGKLIKKWLTGEWEADAHTFELIQTADKMNQQNWINSLEDEGVEVLILDRYTGTELAYAMANNIDLGWKLELQRYMRQPDHVIFIDIPAEVSMKRKGKHNDGVNDRYESDFNLLNNASKSFRELFLDGAKDGRDLIVDGEQSVEVIHDKIYGFVKKQLT